MDRLNKKVKSFLRPWKPPTWVPEDFPGIPETKLKVKQSILDQSLIDRTHKIGRLFLFLFFFITRYRSEMQKSASGS